MRAPTIAAAVALAALAPACGEDSEPPRREPAVKLRLGSPNDGKVVRTETVEIRGTVQPRGATVAVLGREIAVDGGSFSAEVRLPVPDVVGSDADTARDQLEGLGLDVAVENAGGFFDPLLPGDPKVCELEPEPGAQVLPGSEVMLLVARDC